MQSVRRAVLRSAASAIPAASRSSVAVAAPLVRVAVVSARPSVAPAFARYFSQTMTIRNTEESKPTETETATSSTETPAAAEAKETETPAASQEFSATSEEPSPYAVFVRNIVFDVSEQHLEEAFKQYGEVLRTVIARDPRGLSRGYGFIWFTDKNAMETAIEKVNGMFWHGRQVFCKERTPRDRRTDGRSPLEPTNSLYIGNLPYETNDNDLNSLFSNIEGITAVRVAVDRATGWPRGFAHADFDTVEHAKAAKEKLQDIPVGNRTLRIDFAVGRNQGGNRRRRNDRNDRDDRDSR